MLALLGQTLATVGIVPDARADVWGFVDETGTARIAATRLDERYQLFLKGGVTAGPADSAAVVDAAARPAFERTRLFQRAMNHRGGDRFESLIERHAKLQHLDPALVRAIIAVESSFDPDAVSPKGAVGLMQVIPETGERYGIADDGMRTVAQKLRDPEVNVRVGTRYLRDLIALFANDLGLALAAYNAGEGAVARYDNTIPPFAETREYVRLVRQFHSFYRPALPVSPATVRIVVPGRRDALVLPASAGQ
jgi:soluble lytic murein transglycosylase-like protein